jgi:hydrogenase nickel incorporation protein HypA/HybF
MHEMSLAQELVMAVCQESEGRRVLSVKVELGVLSGIIRPVFEQAFEVCAMGTLAEASALEINILSASGLCRQCGNTVETTESWPLCSCGTADIDWVRGREFKLTELELEPCAMSADVQAKRLD